MRRGLKGTPGHQRDVVTGAAGDAVDAGGHEGVGQGHRRQDGASSRASLDMPAPGRVFIQVRW